VVAHSVVAVPMPFAAVAASSSVIAVPLPSPPTASFSKAPSPVAAVQLPSPKGRTSVADRWAKRMGKPPASSPQGSVDAAPEKHFSESTHPVTATEEVVSEPPMDPVEHASVPAPAVPTALKESAGSGFSSRAAAPGSGKVANRCRRLGGGC
jgi:hypothetical protein